MQNNVEAKLFNNQQIKMAIEEVEAVGVSLLTGRFQHSDVWLGFKNVSLVQPHAQLGFYQSHSFFQSY